MYSEAGINRGDARDALGSHMHIILVLLLLMVFPISACSGEAKVLDNSNILTNQRVIELPRHTGVGIIALSPDGKHMAVTSGKAKMIYVMDVQNLETIKEMVREELYVSGDTLAYSPDGHFLVASKYWLSKAPSKHKFVIWDTENYEIVKSNKDEAKDSYSSFSRLDFSPDSRYLIASGGLAYKPKDNVTWGLYDTQTWERVNEVRGVDSADALAFSPAGKQFVSIDYRPIKNDPGKEPLFVGTYSDLLFWDSKSLKVLNRIEGIYRGMLHLLAFSPDGKYLALGGRAGRFKGMAETQRFFQIGVWDIERGKFAQMLDGHESRLDALYYSPKGDYLISLNEAAENNEARIWRPLTGELVERIKLPKTRYTVSLALSADGRKLAMGWETKVFLWDVGW